MQKSSREPTVNKGPIVSAEGPYPEIHIEKIDTRYLRWITQNMASQHSEMSAIYLYLYQHWIFKETHPDFSETARKVAMVEMHHLNILGSLLFGGGGNPKCRSVWNNHQAFWNGSMVSYQQNYRQVLIENIRSEQSAYNQYLTQANKVKDDYLSAIFKRIAADEMVHINLFKKMLEEL